MELTLSSIELDGIDACNNGRESTEASEAQRCIVVQFSIGGIVATTKPQLWSSRIRWEQSVSLGIQRPTGAAGPEELLIQVLDPAGASVIVETSEKLDELLIDELLDKQVLISLEAAALKFSLRLEDAAKIDRSGVVPVNTDASIINEHEGKDRNVAKQGEESASPAHREDGGQECMECPGAVEILVKDGIGLGVDFLQPFVRLTLHPLGVVAQTKCRLRENPDTTEFRWDENLLLPAYSATSPELRPKLELRLSDPNAAKDQPVRLGSMDLSGFLVSEERQDLDVCLTDENGAPTKARLHLSVRFIPYGPSPQPDLDVACDKEGPGAAGVLRVFVLCIKGAPSANNVVQLRKMIASPPDRRQVIKTFPEVLDLRVSLSEARFVAQRRDHSLHLEVAVLQHHDEDVERLKLLGRREIGVDVKTLSTKAHPWRFHLLRDCGIRVKLAMLWIPDDNDVQGVELSMPPQLKLNPGILHLWVRNARQIVLTNFINAGVNKRNKNGGEDVQNKGDKQNIKGERQGMKGNTQNMKLTSLRYMYDHDDEEDDDGFQIDPDDDKDEGAANVNRSHDRDNDDDESDNATNEERTEVFVEAEILPNRRRGRKLTETTSAFQSVGGRADWHELLQLRLEEPKYKIRDVMGLVPPTLLLRLRSSSNDELGRVEVPLFAFRNLALHRRKRELGDQSSWPHAPVRPLTRYLSFVNSKSDSICATIGVTGVFVTEEELADDNVKHLLRALADAQKIAKALSEDTWASFRLSSASEQALATQNFAVEDVKLSAVSSRLAVQSAAPGVVDITVLRARDVHTGSDGEEVKSLSVAFRTCNTSGNGVRRTKGALLHSNANKSDGNSKTKLQCLSGNLQVDVIEWNEEVSLMIDDAYLDVFDMSIIDNSNATVLAKLKVPSLTFMHDTNKIVKRWFPLTTRRHHRLQGQVLLGVRFKRDTPGDSQMVTDVCAFGSAAIYANVAESTTLRQTMAPEGAANGVVFVRANGGVAPRHCDQLLRVTAEFAPAIVADAWDEEDNATDVDDVLARIGGEVYSTSRTRCGLDGYFSWPSDELCTLQLPWCARMSERGQNPFGAFVRLRLTTESGDDVGSVDVAMGGLLAAAGEVLHRQLYLSDEGRVDVSIVFVRTPTASVKFRSVQRANAIAAQHSTMQSFAFANRVTPDTHTKPFDNRRPLHGVATGRFSVFVERARNLNLNLEKRSKASRIQKLRLVLYCEKQTDATLTVEARKHPEWRNTLSVFVADAAISALSVQLVGDENVFVASATLSTGALLKAIWMLAQRAAGSEGDDPAVVAQKLLTTQASFWCPLYHPSLTTSLAASNSTRKLDVNGVSKCVGEFKLHVRFLPEAVIPRKKAKKRGTQLRPTEDDVDTLTAASKGEVKERGMLHVTVVEAQIPEPMVVFVKLRCGGYFEAATALEGGENPVFNQSFAMGLRWAEHDKANLPSLTVVLLNADGEQLGSVNVPLEVFVVHSAQPAHLWLQMVTRESSKESKRKMRVKVTITFQADSLYEERRNWLQNDRGVAGVLSVKALSANGLDASCKDPICVATLWNCNATRRANTAKTFTELSRPNDCKADESADGIVMETQAAVGQGSSPCWDASLFFLVVAMPKADDSDFDFGGTTPVLEVTVLQSSSSSSKSSKNLNPVVAKVEIPLFPCWLKEGRVTQRWYPLRNVDGRYGGRVQLELHFVKEYDPALFRRRRRHQLDRFLKRQSHSGGTPLVVEVVEGFGLRQVAREKHLNPIVRASVAGATNNWSVTGASCAGGADPRWSAVDGKMEPTLLVKKTRQTKKKKKGADSVLRVMCCHVDDDGTQIFIGEAYVGVDIAKPSQEVLAHLHDVAGAQSCGTLLLRLRVEDGVDYSSLQHFQNFSKVKAQPFYRALSCCGGYRGNVHLRLKRVVVDKESASWRQRPDECWFFKAILEHSPPTSVSITADLTDAAFAPGDETPFLAKSMKETVGPFELPKGTIVLPVLTPPRELADRDSGLDTVDDVVCVAHVVSGVDAAAAARHGATRGVLSASWRLRDFPPLLSLPGFECDVLATSENGIGLEFSMRYYDAAVGFVHARVGSLRGLRNGFFEGVVHGAKLEVVLRLLPVQPRKNGGESLCAAVTTCERDDKAPEFLTADFVAAPTAAAFKMSNQCESHPSYLYVVVVDADADVALAATKVPLQNIIQKGVNAKLRRESDANGVELGAGVLGWYTLHPARELNDEDADYAAWRRFQAPELQLYVEFTPHPEMSNPRWLPEKGRERIDALKQLKRLYDDEEDELEMQQLKQALVKVLKAHKRQSEGRARKEDVDKVAAGSFLTDLMRKHSGIDDILAELARRSMRHRRRKAFNKSRGGKTSLSILTEKYTKKETADDDECRESDSDKDDDDCDDDGEVKDGDDHKAICWEVFARFLHRKNQEHNVSYVDDLLDTMAPSDSAFFKTIPDDPMPIEDRLSPRPSDHSNATTPRTQLVVHDPGEPLTLASQRTSRPHLREEPNIARNALEWSVADVQSWLKSLELSEHARNFRQLAVDGVLLLELNADLLRDELGVKKKVHIVKLLKYIDRLRTERDRVEASRRAKLVLDARRERDDLDKTLALKIPTREKESSPPRGRQKSSLRQQKGATAPRKRIPYWASVTRVFEVVKEAIWDLNEDVNKDDVRKTAEQLTSLFECLCGTPRTRGSTLKMTRSHFQVVLRDVVGIQMTRVQFDELFRRLAQEGSPILTSEDFITAFARKKQYSTGRPRTQKKLHRVSPSREDDFRAGCSLKLINAFVNATTNLEEGKTLLSLFEELDGNSDGVLEVEEFEQLLSILFNGPQYQDVAADVRALHRSVARSGVQVVELFTFLAILWAAEYDRVGVPTSKSAAASKEALLYALSSQMPPAFRAALLRKVDNESGAAVHSMTGPFLSVLTALLFDATSIKLWLRRALRAVQEKLSEELNSRVQGNKSASHSWWPSLIQTAMEVGDEQNDLPSGRQSGLDEEVRKNLALALGMKPQSSTERVPTPRPVDMKYQR